MRKLLVVMLMGCDPAGSFVGRWTGPESVTVDFGNGPESVSAGVVTEEFSENLSTGDIDFGECGWVASVLNASTMTLEANSTPCLASNDGTCATSLAVLAGQGVVRGSSMSLDLHGLAVVNCSTNPTKTGPYSMHVDATRQ